jgi:hypothetical protein
MSSRLLTFIDRHPALAISRPNRRRLHSEARQQLVDAHGVRPIGHWAEDGTIYCVLEAPDQAAVCQHHADRDLPCDQIHPIAGVDGSRPISVVDNAAVRAFIARTWHSPARATV